MKTSPDTVEWQDLKRKLTTDGEAMTETELSACLRTLVGSESSIPSGGDEFNASKFAGDILGFVDYENE